MLVVMLLEICINSAVDEMKQKQILLSKKYDSLRFNQYFHASGRGVRNTHYYLHETRLPDIIT